ncbi:stage II sporulation protein R [Paenibacillus sp. UNC451MF]|uniref:stage II sporulation protein R n=1 Tax=Paenibacillus sp. UNC451MF TaxID=1449063 RepID=UPI00048CD9E4|nr:stage II sporulation protein R [Paenibacillus sp. UNC451MF]
MVKRTSRVRYYYIAFALILLIFCWEAQRENAIVFASKVEAASASSEGVIPQESIRLRILANSDSPSDQWVKREVRDAIVEQMSRWVTGPQTIEEARQTVRNHLPELNDLVGHTLRKNGFDYTYQVELGVVPFPTKMYGSEVYPAGNYEALRVSIGEAEGQNWWCVLFPPLCFVDSEVIAKKSNEVRAEAAPETEKAAISNAKDGQVIKANKDTKVTKSTNGSVQEAKVAAASENGKAAVAKADAQPEQPEVRFFLWDLIKKIGSMFA